MKENILRELVNDLRDIAIHYHGHQCLRELIRKAIIDAIEDDRCWQHSSRSIRKSKLLSRSKVGQSNATKD